MTPSLSVALRGGVVLGLDGHVWQVEEEDLTGSSGLGQAMEGKGRGASSAVPDYSRLGGKSLWSGWRKS